MAHLPHLIQDLSIILITASVVTVLFKMIGQPVVLGYIIAGFLIGPNFSFFPTISDIPNIQTWAEIGIIFLLFALGLEFSFKKVVKVGGAATVTASIEVLGTIIIGYFTGRFFGWSTMDSLFLGGILSISSTTIIIRAFEEVGVKGRGFVSLVFGILIIEDLVAILLLVILSSLAMSQQLDGFYLIQSTIQLIFFICIWFLSGIFVLPTLFRTVQRHMNDEALLIISLGLCFLLVVLATNSGFSAALGAFMMGSILAETKEAERIESIIKSVKDLFAAIFFVSVGMLINPKLLVQYAPQVLIITCITIFGKIFSTSLGALIAGRSLRHSLQAGLSLAQIGEFSFIIATLGLKLKVTSEFLYPIAVGVSVLTTFSTPYLIRSTDRIQTWMETLLPEGVKDILLRYQGALQRISGKKEWHSRVRFYATILITNSVIITAIILFLSNLMPKVLTRYLSSTSLINFISLLTTLMAAAPFFWALVSRRIKIKNDYHLLKNQDYKLLYLVFEGLRYLTGLVLLLSLASQFVEVKTFIILIVILMLIGLVILSKYLKKIYAWFEHRFVYNLLGEKNHEVTSETPRLAPWDAHLVQFKIPAHSQLNGKNLTQLALREKMGITVALVERGEYSLPAPRGEEVIYPGDRISIIGTDDQIAQFSKYLHSNVNSHAEKKPKNYGLHQFEVQVGMELVGKSIRNSGLREKIDGLVVGIERKGYRILNPESQLYIEVGDIIWVVGNQEKLARLETLKQL